MVSVFQQLEISEPIHKFLADNLNERERKYTKNSQSERARIRSLVRAYKQLMSDSIQTIKNVLPFGIFRDYRCATHNAEISVQCIDVTIAIGFDFFKKKLFSCSSVGLIPKELPCGLHYNNKNVCLNTSLVNDSKCIFLLWPSTSRFFVTITFLCDPSAPEFSIRWLTQFEVSHASIDDWSSLLYSNFSTKSEFSSSITSTYMRLFAVRVMLNCINTIRLASTLCIFVVFQWNFIYTERLLYRVDKLIALSMPANLKKLDARY